MRAATSAVEQRLQFVGEPLDDGQLHHAGVSLERVEGAKHGRQRVCVLRTLLEHEHALFDVLQQILRLGAEEPHELAIGVIREDGEELRGSRRAGRRGRGLRPGLRRLGLRCDGLRHRTDGSLLATRRRLTAPGNHRLLHPRLPVVQMNDRVGAERCRHARAGLDTAAGLGRQVADRLWRVNSHGLFEFGDEPPQFLRWLFAVRIDERQLQADLPQEFLRVFGGGRSFGRHESMQDEAGDGEDLSRSILTPFFAARSPTRRVGRTFPRLHSPRGPHERHNPQHRHDLSRTLASGLCSLPTIVSRSATTSRKATA